MALADDVHDCFKRHNELVAENVRLREALETMVRCHTEGVGPCDASCADEMLRVAREALRDD